MQHSAPSSPTELSSRIRRAKTTGFSRETMAERMGPAGSPAKAATWSAASSTKRCSCAVSKTDHPPSAVTMS
jgi:hypothetical protein